MQLLRHLGLAARFVSGYLIQLVADVKPLDGPAGPAADFTDLHAWCEVYLPGAGWIGLDPTSGLLAGEGHIPLACTPEPSAAAPCPELVDDCEAKFEYAMRVDAFWEAPRVTKPYIEAQWTAIELLGRRSMRSSWPSSMCASRWAASRHSYRAMIRMSRNGTPRRWAKTSAARGAAVSGG